MAIKDVLTLAPADFWFWGGLAYKLRLERLALAGVDVSEIAQRELDEMMFGGPSTEAAKAIKRWENTVDQKIGRQHGAGRHRK